MFIVILFQKKSAVGAKNLLLKTKIYKHVVRSDLMRSRLDKKEAGEYTIWHKDTTTILYIGFRPAYLSIP